MVRTRFVFFVILGITISSILYSCRGNVLAKEPVSTPFKWIKSDLEYDTIYSDNKIITTIKFLHEYSLVAEFKNDDNFSFLDPEYFSKWSISRNGIPLAYKTDQFDWAYYFYTIDSILQYQNDDHLYYLIFNKPFYCNGYACCDNGILILEKTHDSTKVRYYDSQFCDDSLVINSIRESSEKSQHLVLPIRCSDVQKDSICDYLVVDSLKN